MTVEATRSVARAGPDSVVRYARPVLDRARSIARVWQARYRYRQQLAKWSERELQDVGLSRAGIEYEVRKPFWRA
jgi:uncharacterized protein YjiS (DUF1127 family)